MTQKDNPARDIARNARSVMMGAHVILALGTAAVGWMLVMNWTWLSANVSPLTHSIFAVIGGLGFYWLLDQKALVFLPYAVNVVLRMFGMKPGEAVRLNQKSGFMKLFDWIAVIVAVVMIAGSAYMNFVVTPDLGGMVTGTADTSTEQNAMQQNNTVFLSGQKGFESSVERAQNAVAEAEQKAQKLIEDAKRSKGAELARLASGGNDWARQQIAGAVASATRKGERLVKRANDNLTTAQGKLDAYVEKQGGKVISGNEKLTGLITTTLTSHNTRLSNYTGVLWYVMLGSLLLFIGCCVMVEIYESETGDQVKPAATISKVLGAAQQRAGTGMLSGLARALGVRDRVEFRVQPGGTMAATLPRTAARPDSLGRTLSPAEIREREHWKRDVERQEERRREPVEQNTDRDWTERQKDRTQNTETTQNADRTEKQTQQGSGVGDGSYPDPTDKEAMKAFTKRLRAASAYNANDPRVIREINWMRSEGWRCEERDGGKWIITRPVKTTGTVENEYAWEVMGSGENSEA